MVGRLRQDEFRVNTDEGGGQLHVERFTQTKVEGELSAKTLRNLLLVLQAILSLAVDNDLIARQAFMRSGIRLRALLTSRPAT
jgi:hypothetical protein